MTDQTAGGPREPLDGPGSAREASDGELPGRDGDSGAQGHSGGSGWTQLEARAFNAVQPALRTAGEWLPLSARRAVANAVLAELKRELDAIARVHALVDEHPVAVGTHLLEAALDLPKEWP